MISEHFPLMVTGQPARGMVLVTNTLSITKSQQEFARQAGVIVICGDAIGSFGHSLLGALQ